MPQKKNPDLTELLRGKMRPAPRCRDSAHAALLKGLPLAYNKDMQETQEPVFEVADTIARACSGCCRLHPRTQLPHRSHARRCANPDFSTPWPPPRISSTKAFPSARRTRRSATPFATASTRAASSAIFRSTRLRQFGDEFDEDFFAAITLQATLDCHDVIGGTARARVHAALDGRRRARRRHRRRTLRRTPLAKQETTHAGA